MVARFEATGLEMGEPDADLDALLEEQAALQAKIEDADAWNLQVRRSSETEPGRVDFVVVKPGRQYVLSFLPAVFFPVDVCVFVRVYLSNRT